MSFITYTIEKMITADGRMMLLIANVFEANILDISKVPHKDTS